MDYLFKRTCRRISLSDVVHNVLEFSPNQPILETLYRSLSILFTSIFSPNILKWCVRVCVCVKRNFSESRKNYCNDTTTSFAVRMYRKDGVTRNNLSYSLDREGGISLNFSRHLCVTARMARSLENQRTARRLGDSETTTNRQRTGSRPFDNSKERFGRQQSAEEPLSRRQVYNMGKTFQQKFGHTNKIQGTNTLVPSSYWTNREAFQTDDETKSFCDSVSSNACSNFARTDVDNRKPWIRNNRKFPDKISKFQAIEKWLQSLPEPEVHN